MVLAVIALGGCLVRPLPKGSGSIEGRVVWGEGIPQEDVKVLANGRYSGYTDEDGYFVIESVPEGTYTLTAEYEFAKLSGGKVSVTVQDGKSAQVGDLVLDTRFVDSFTEAKDDWNVAGNAVVENGVFSFPAGGNAYTNENVGAMGMRFDLKGSGVICINFHNPNPGVSSGTNNNYDYGYVLWIQAKPGAEQVNIIKPKAKEGGGYEIHWLPNCNFQFSTDISPENQTVTFEIIKTKAKETDASNASYWKITMNGQVMFEDDTPAVDKAANSGYFGIWAREGSWTLDNFVVWEIEEQ